MSELVVGPEGVKAVAKKFARWALPDDVPWDELNDAAQGQAVGITRDALLAAGIVVADVSVEVRPLYIYALPRPENGKCVNVEPGDTIYVKRGEAR